MDDSNKIVSSRHSSTNACMNSQRSWQHAQDLHGLMPVGILVLRWEVDAGSHLYPRNYLQLMAAGKGKRKKCHLIYQKHFRADPMPGSNWPTQNKLHGLSLGFVWTFFWSYFLFFFFHFFKRKRKEQSWLSRELGMIWEKGKNMIKIYCMKKCLN